MSWQGELLLPLALGTLADRVRLYVCYTTLLLYGPLVQGMVQELEERMLERLNCTSCTAGKVQVFERAQQKILHNQVTLLMCFNALSFIQSIHQSIQSKKKIYFIGRSGKSLVSKTMETLPLSTGWAEAATCENLPNGLLESVWQILKRGILRQDSTAREFVTVARFHRIP